MTTLIKGIGDLKIVVESKIIKALELTRDEIFEVVSRKVFDYYEEPVFSPPNKKEPDYYNRTYKLIKSLTASHINKKGTYYEFTVGWDDEYLTFKYSDGFGLNGPYNGITGLRVLNYFNSSSHGGTVGGSHKFFDEAIDELGGKDGIKNKFKKNLQKCGLPIK